MDGEKLFGTLVALYLFVRLTTLAWILWERSTKESFGTLE